MMIRCLACTVVAVFLFECNEAHGAVILSLNAANQLQSFDSSSPNITSAAIAVTGLQAGERLVGIDVRPASNQLYGLAVSGANNSVGRLYTIDALSGVAVSQSTISEALNGTVFGVDFNPVADRLRLISNLGQNLRINVVTGATIVDTPISFAVGDPNAATAPSVVASAYTNSFAGALTTTLYNLNAPTQSLVIQNPPNNGTLNTVGNLGTPVSQDASFEIDGSTGIGYAVLSGVQFSTINLATGAATFVGNINSTSNVIGITTFSPVPEPTSMLMLAATGVGAFALRRRLKRAR